MLLENAFGGVYGKVDTSLTRQIAADPISNGFWFHLVIMKVIKGTGEEQLLHSYSLFFTLLNVLSQLAAELFFRHLSDKMQHCDPMGGLHSRRCLPLSRFVC